MKRCLVLNLDTVEYGKAWQLQRNLFSARSLDKIDDVLVLTQHPPTYTIGRRGNTNQLLITEEELMRRGYSVYKVDRGGAVTYHGPGQIVCYPILGMKSYTEDYYEYLRMLEEVMIRTLNELGIYAGRRTGFTGVWVKGEKIGSIGVRIVMGYTMHGFSLNVNNDLSPFSMIIPCNIQDVKMTSISRVLGAFENPPLSPFDKGGLRGIIVRHFANVFGAELTFLKNGRPLIMGRPKTFKMSESEPYHEIC